MRRWHFGEDPGPLREVLARGGILAIPTESSYGLAADPRNPVGVEAIFAAKGRAGSQPLPVVIAGVEQLAELGIEAGSAALASAARYWPAPLSILLRIAMPLPAAAGSGSLAVRVPAHSELRSLLDILGPLTATSANHSGAPPILEPDEAVALLAGTDAVLVDGGVLPGGPPSTLVEWTPAGWHVLRSGSFDPTLLFSAGAAENSAEIGGSPLATVRAERNA